MKKLILLTYLSFTLICSAQIDFVKQADLLLNAYRTNEKKQFDKSLELYEQAFAIHTANSTIDYTRAAVSAAELKKEEHCKRWITEAIIKKEASKDFLITFSDNEIYQKCLTSILPKYDTLLTQFYKSIANPKAYLEIQKLHNRDQFSRKIEDYYLGISEKQQEEAFELYLKAQASKDTIALKKYSKIIFPKIDKVYKDYNLKIMRYTDSLNVVKLIDLTKDFGWQEEAWLILWHQRGTYGQENWVWDYFKPLIDEEIRKGNKRKSIGLPAMTAEEIEQRNAQTRGGRAF